MVRETRHLWVGNLPDNIREDRIREHFKRYGRVQSVKLLPRSSKEETCEGTMACTVAFMDIKSASKAHNTEHKVDDRTLTTEYYEPAAIPSAASPQTSPYSTSPGSNRFPNGHSSADEHGPFVERFYDRGGGGVVVGGGRAVTDGEFPTSRRNATGVPVGAASGGVAPGVPSYHDASSRGSARNRDRGFRNGPYNVIIDRGSHRTLNNSWCYEGGVGGGAGAGAGGRYNNSQNETGYNNNGAALTTNTTTTTTTASGSTTLTAAAVAANAASAGTNAAAATGATTGVVGAAGDNSGAAAAATERRSTSDQSTKKKTKSRSGSRSISPSGSNSSRSPSRSRSRSSSSSSSSSTSRCSSTSSPKSRRTAANSHLAHSDDRRPLAICVKNLPLRSSDTSLKDGLYHEYKKHGKVTSVKVVGQNSERHAIVCFKKPEDVEKALEVSYDKLFFGCKIDVAPYQGYDVEDNDLRPYEAEIDEYHPKATRTLFIGNLEKDVTASDLRKTFDQFGEIIEIDIKNQGNVSLYAFCQYSDIVSVVKAIRKMDGEHLGNNRIKLGFGKSMPTNVVWVDGVGEHVNEKYLRMQFDPFGPISKISVDRDRGQALIFYEQMVGAQSAVSKMRGYNLKGNKIQVDFASRECQQSFYEHLEKQTVDREERRDSTSRSFDSGRYARYDTPTRARTSSYSSRSSIAASQVTSAIPSPGTPGSVTPRGTASKTRLGRFAEYYEGAELNDRHFRSYDEYSQGSAASQDDPYDPDYGYGNHDSPSHLDILEARSMQSVCTVEHGTIPYGPPDIRNLQKERVHLLEQLEECPSSGDEHISSKKRIKLDLLDSAIIGTDVIIEANRDHRKVMEVRRLSDVSLKHHSSRRPSIDNSGKHSRELTHERTSTAYVPHAICKRRKTGGSDAGSRIHHYDHSGSESVGGSRPGTPLCDERPENFPPSEPRRVPRDRDGPLTLPLPKFASQIMGRGSVSVAGIKGQKDNNVLLSSPPPAVTSPRISNPRPVSPVQVHVPPPASPPPRPPSLSSNSSDSDVPPSPSLDERIKSLDEKYEKWSGSRALSAAGGDALAKLDATREKFRLRHKLLDFDLKEVQPSEIVKSVMAKRSVFDEDLKRLENVGEKYEPKEFHLFPRTTAVPTQCSTTTVPLTTAATIKITSPSTQLPKTPTLLSPRSTGNSMIPVKGLQYPFPSHPPIQPPAAPPLPQQTPPSTIASPTQQFQAASTTTRSANLGDTRLKPCASASSDNRICSSKVNVNRCAVPNVAAQSTPPKNSEKPSGNNIPSDSTTSSNSGANIETKTPRTTKHSDKITCRRDSAGSSPRGDIKSRRNSDVSSRRTEETEKISDTSLETDQKSSERAKSEERKKEQQHKEKLRLENERLERERLEKEQQEKERLEKERLEREKQEREKELEKERLEKKRLEKERAEQERLERERSERERREREEQERQERARREEQRIREERERKEREENERREREIKERLEHERQAKKEAEKLERERRREDEKKHKEDNHDRRKEEHKHRENHGETKHKDNNINLEKSNNEHRTKQSSKEEKERAIHEIFKRNDSHDRNNSDKLKNLDKETEMRRKESIKENRDNNTHEKQRNNDAKDIESRHMSIDLDKPSIKSESNKKRERNNSLPANIGIKRRMSSQESFDNSAENKKPKLHSDQKKISDRRDSKDSIRSEDRSKCKVKNNVKSSSDEKSFPLEKTNHSREPEEKRKEKEKDKEDKHKSKQRFDKQKTKSKSREKDPRESPSSTMKELTDRDFLAKLELRSNEDIEKQKEHKKEKRKQQELVDFETDKREKEEKRSEEKSKRENRPSDKNKQQKDEKSSKMMEDAMKHQRKPEKIRKTTLNSSDNNTDSDEPKKHSIFDIVDDEPAYISMYDKVKARSCKNMQKQEEEKRQEKIKAKFSQLKQSRAKREEKKRSTSWDEDSESDRERHHEKNDSKSRRNKMLIVSSDDEFSDLGKSHKKRDIFTDSDSDRHRHINKNEMMEVSDEDYVRHKSRKTSRSTNEISDDDIMKNIHPIKTEIFSENEMDRSSDHDFKHFKVKDEFKKSIKKERKASKQEDSFDKIDTEQQMDLKPPLTEIKPEKVNNRHLFDNSSADESTEFKKEKSKKHKKKQKRLKHSLSSEDSSKFDSLDSSQITESLEKMKHHDKKRQHSKKDKKRDKSKERDKSKKSKRSKSTSKSDFKHDGKMENIFGSLSDSSDNGVRDTEAVDVKVNKFLGDFNDENVPSIFSDSDMEKAVKLEEIDAKEEHRKRKERRRKEKERRLQEAAAAAALAEAAVHFNENSMDFADLGKQLEDNIKDEPADNSDGNLEKTNVNTEPESAFNYYDGDASSIYQEYKKEDRKDSREKKKKRKKSKEERQKHHHHHDKNKIKNENKKEHSCSTTEEPSMPILQESNPPLPSQSLPNLLDIASPPQEKVNEKPNASTEKEPNVRTSSPISSQATSVQSKEKKRDKFIPGFGAEIDEAIHENAVKSISEFDSLKPTECSNIVEETTNVEKTEESTEEKPRAVISQEETEDAVAALLGESFSNERYSEDDMSGNNDQTSAMVEEPNVQDDEEMRQAVQSLGAADLEVKPDTPQSEHELQIDTDTEEQDEISMRFDQQPKTPDMSELLHPPKTPDIPTYFRSSDESKGGMSSTLSPLVIKAPPNIGSPPSLAPITPHTQPSIIATIKRNLDVVTSEGSCKIPPLTVPPLVEPARTAVVPQPWSSSSKASEETTSTTSKADLKSTTKVVTAAQTQSLTITSSTPVRTYPSMVKLSESSFPPLTAISKPDAVILTATSKPEVSVATLPILQVATAPALHNLPARSPVPEKKSPSNLPPEMSLGGPPKITATYSKIRLPITSVMVSKPLQATTINLPQAKVAFSSEPPKLIPTQDPRPRMIFQNANMSGPFPFSPNQKMVVQTNIPMARGLLVPARPGHFNYITSSQEKSTDLSKTATVTTSSMTTLNCPSDKIQIKPQPILISPNSHIPTNACLINSQKVIRPIIPEAPPTLVAISSTNDIPTSLQSNIVAQQKIPTSPVRSVEPQPENVEGKQRASPIEDKDVLLQPPTIDSKDVQSVIVKEEKLESSTTTRIVEEKPKQLAIEKVTEELNLALKKAKDSEFDKLKEDRVEIEEKEVPIKVEESEPEMKPEEKTNADVVETIIIKESEKLEEEKTDSESIVSDMSKDCSSADIPMKDLLDNREDKEDSDYWSPKDVNIDSVIKTLCSADELSNHSNDNGNNKEENVMEDPKVTPEKDKSSEMETIDKDQSDIKDLESNKSDSETMDDSIEDNDDKDSTKVGTRRGGARGGRGRKGRGGIERGGIQTRRGKILSKDATTPTKRTAANTPRGGKGVKVERKATKSESEIPTTDIYEFREDEENRPRLILTIKQSNTNSAAVQSAVVKEVPKETVTPPQQQQQQHHENLPQTPSKPTIDTKEKVEEFAQPSANTNTRKSRRLQEKDISRTTVDDTIEDVVKNTVVTRSNSQATRRSTRQPPSNAKTSPETPRKSPRGRRIGRRASEAGEETAEEKKSNEPLLKEVAAAKAETEKAIVKEPSPAPSANEKEDTRENMVVPVKETPPIGLKAAVLRRVKGEMGQEPMTLIDPVTGLLTPMRECEENKYIPVPGEKKIGSNVVMTTISTTIPSVAPVLVTSAAETAKITAQQGVITTTSTPSQPLVAAVKPQPAKPQSLKAHVLSSQAAQAIVTQQVTAAQKQTALLGRATPPSIISAASDTKMVNLPMTQTLNVNVSTPNYGPVHLSPRTNIPLAASGSPKPLTVKQPMASPSQMYNLMAQQHKQLLQIGKSTATAVIPKGIVVSTASIMKHQQQQQQQPIMKQVPLSKVSKTGRPIHLPAGGIPGSVVGSKTQPVQPMVAGANRMMQGKGPMEPPKVDVSLSNLMSVRGLSSLSPQGQPRHLSQSGMPVPGYEASLAETIPHFPPGSVTLRPPHDLPPPHYMHPSHMYQQYLRQSYHFPRSSLVPGGMEKPGDGQEGEEAPVTSPPLELRMPGSVGIPLSSRATVPHGLHSPHDRATDSPQVGQVYNMQTARMQHYNHRYYEPPAEPPPAHRPVTSHSSLAALGGDRPPPMSHSMAALGAAGPHLPPGAAGHLPSDRPLSGGHPSLTAAHLPLGTPERPSSSHLPPDRPLSSGGHMTPVTVMPDRPVSAHGLTMGAGLGAAGNLMGAVARHIGVDASTSQRGLQAATPPHASQVPPQAESLFMLLKQYPRMWQGLLALKNDQAAVQMYFVSGNDDVAKCSLPKNTDGSTPPLRIFQRMRLEPPQVEGVARKMQMEKEHCMLLALPCGHDHMDVLKQSTNLTNGFITYLQQKQAAGIVNVAAPGTTQPPAYVVHIFPSCNFVNENLRRIAPSLLERVADIAHLLIVITTV